MILDAQRQQLLVMAVGEVIVDHVFEKETSDYTYLFSRPGGSVSNILANLAGNGFNARFFALAGADAGGEFARETLAASGIDVSNVSLSPRLKTQPIFHIIERAASGAATYSHVFKVRRPWANDRIGEVISNASSPRLRREALEAVQYHDVICFDRLNQRNADIAARANECHKLSFLDLGQSSYLRYFSTTRLYRLMRPFDFILMSRQVSRAVLSRIEGLYSRDNVAQQLREVGLRSVLVMSNGDAPLTLFDLRHEKPVPNCIEIEPYKGPVLETSGAGDALMASVIARLEEMCALDPNSFGSLAFDALESVVRAGVQRLGPVLNSIGATSHIRMPEVPSDIWRSYRGMSLGQIARSAGAPWPLSTYADAAGVPAEALIIPQRRSRVANTVAQNVGKLIEQTSHLAFKPDVVKKVRAVVDRLSGNGFVVGSGGSHSVAHFISRGLNCSENVFSVPTFPFEYVRQAKRTDFVILVSYSGKTPDCEKVIVKALSMKVPKENIILVTGAARAPLADLLAIDTAKPAAESENVLSYASPEGWMERGFVSVTGTVAPCALFCTAFESFEATLHLLASYRLKNDVLGFATGPALRRVLGLPCGARTADAPAQDNGHSGVCLSLIGGGFAWPAMIDIESKFSEGGLGVVRLNEFKDFSHGRFMSLLTKMHLDEPVLLLRDRNPSAFIDKLERTLTARKSDAVLTMRSAYLGALAGLDLLIRAQYFIREVAALCQVDIARPGSRLPRAGIDLYRWRGRFD